MCSTERWQAFSAKTMTFKEMRLELHYSLARDVFNVIHIFFDNTVVNLFSAIKIFISENGRVDMDIL